MRCQIRILTTLLVLASLHAPLGSAVSQEAPDKSTKPDASKADEKKNNSLISVQIKISADGKPSLPSESKIQWSGADDACKQKLEEKSIGPGGVTTVTVLPCKIKVLIMITGFDTKTVTLDLAKNNEKSPQTVTITVKRQGPPVVAW
jgi:hypothetical protein